MAFEITAFKKDDGPLTKVFHVVDGKLSNDSSQCQMSAGAAKRFFYENAADLAAIINKCGPTQALALGRIKADGDRHRVVAKKRLEDNPG